MLKRSLIFVHKWLGVLLALLFLMWFVSGLVLYFVPFPSLTTAERLAGLPALKLPAGCCLTADAAGAAAGLTFTDARLGMRGEVPVWRLLASGAPSVTAGEGGYEAAGAGGKPRWQAVDAQTGAVLPPLTAAATTAVAESFSQRPALKAEPVEEDQWSTAQSLNAHRPLLRVFMAGDDGLELYVSPSSGEVLRDTHRAERFWNWLGAVPHWYYFSQLRDWPGARKNLVIWTASLGVVAALSGVVLGIWQLFLNRSRWIPYRQFWPRWHHMLGLLAGIVTFTWILSGLLSVNPWGLFSTRDTSAPERASWTGSASGAAVDPGAALRAAEAAQPGLAAREIDLLRVAGQAWYRVRGQSADAQQLVRADAAPGAQPKAAALLPDALMQSTLTGLRGSPAKWGVPVVTRLDRYDALYYAREYESDTNKKFNRPLPVWRAEWADGVAVYVDPASGRVLMRQDLSNRVQRVLYNGLHSLDFRFLMERPWLRTPLVVLLSLLGVALSVTSCVLAWRALVPRRRERAFP
ncbi:MAG: PepSY-associated TM helix domain-containing protein [Polaromonas sp.]|nr:PepSY-associated TM helix domain-containing protein [Polaromonas sp.]